MDPQEFLAEFYRRLFAHRAQATSGMPSIPLDQYIASHAELIAPIAYNYQELLPSSREARILEVGYGDGNFLAACRSWGYHRLYGIEYSTLHKQRLADWGIGNTYTAEGGIADCLQGMNEAFDVIFASHVLEHIPKYDLITTMDVVMQTLVPGGCVILTTPNMTNPAALRSRYLTLGHETGFVEESLERLLHISGCEHTEVRPFRHAPQGPKIVIGNVLRWLTILPQRLSYRLHGAGETRYFSESIIGIGTKPRSVTTRTEG